MLPLGTKGNIPYVFHFASWLMPSVFVYNSSFLDDAVFVCGCYHKFLDSVGTLKLICSQNSHLRHLECGTSKKVLWFLLVFLWSFVCYAIVFDWVESPVLIG